MLKDLSIHMPIWMDFDDLKPLYDVEKEVHACLSLWYRGIGGHLQRRSEGGAGRTGRHLLGAANGRKLFFKNSRENSDCNFICVCVQ